MSNITAANKIDRSIVPPINPLLRLPQVLQIVPVGRSTWWQWVASGKAPSPVKLGPRCTAWREQDIRKFVEAMGV